MSRQDNASTEALRASYGEYLEAREAHEPVRSAYIEDKDDPGRQAAFERSSDRLLDAKRAVAGAVRAVHGLTERQYVRMIIGPDLEPEERDLVERLIA